MAAPGDIPVRVRSFTPADLPACQKLYVDGSLSGMVAENDTGCDISDIDYAYMRTEGCHFWVAETPEGEVVGMIGVQQHTAGTGEIRRLRVRSDYRRRGVGSALVEKALGFCQEHDYLKVALDTFMDREPAIALFKKFRFHHSRTKKVGEKDLLYFYLDLYGSTERRQDGSDTQNVSQQP